MKKILFLLFIVSRFSSPLQASETDVCIDASLTGTPLEICNSMCVNLQCGDSHEYYTSGQCAFFTERFITLTSGEMPPCLPYSNNGFYPNELYCYSNWRVGDVERCTPLFNPEIDQLDTIDESDGTTEYEICLMNNRAQFDICMLNMQMFASFECNDISQPCYDEYEITGDYEAFEACLEGVQGEIDACNEEISESFYFNYLLDDSGPYEASIDREDAEDGLSDGWDVYDNNPAGAVIENVYDIERDSRVIEFTGSGTANGYRLRNTDNSYWDDTDYNIIEWSMRFSENFVVYIAVQTTDGFRYIYYTAADKDNLGTGTYIHHGLGSSGNDVRDGNWHTFIRDLDYDLKEAQPDNNIEAVLGFLVRGNGRVDDIKTRKTLPAVLDSDADGVFDIDEIMIYSIHPYKDDSDGDTLTDGAELTYWGTAWNNDLDGDALINILDPDSDGDTILDGLEISQGTDPADGNSYPTNIVYEDGEDGGIAGWDAYDSVPSGTSIVNVYDDIRDSRVIEFTGSGTSNGYRLRNNDFSYWNDTNFNVIEWSMQYSENFVVYIAARTTNGFRYIYYTAANSDNLGTGTYVHHGLGSQIKDGNWHTITRDLESDLKDAQPDNELEAVLGFLIRGSGRVDDIRTREAMPAVQ